MVVALIEPENRLLGAPYRVETALKPCFHDSKAKELLQLMRDFLHLPVKQVRIVEVYTIYKELPFSAAYDMAYKLFHDPITQTLSFDSPIGAEEHAIEVVFKEGVNDNAGKVAEIASSEYLGDSFKEGEKISYSRKYLIEGKLDWKDKEKIGWSLLANPILHDIYFDGAVCPHSSTSRNLSAQVEIIPLNAFGAFELEKVSKERHLALALSEMEAIQSYYADEKISKRRRRYGLPPNPTDVELEALAQTWSEHCKHKIFQAHIRYRGGDIFQEIDGLFPTYIKKATEEMAGDIDWLVSVFSDNAGIIRFNDSYYIACKVETHNSPSALDPYGGALTGVLGVNRDILGAGIGARVIANTDVLCFAPPDYQGEIPKRILHPKRVLEGVCQGIEHGGNKSGVPTVNGSFQFDECYLGKPLVYCGSLGIMPSEINGISTHVKAIHEGDLIVIAGGKTGRDGIHGATFSSEVLHAASPSTAVQIGDPFTQKKLHDFLLEARDKGLYRALTDNGAGGFSSSIGELAQLSGGCEIHLEKALLKEPGLAPWEILLSESQERMTLAVPAGKWEELCTLSRLHEVDIITLGTFTANGSLHVFYEGKTVALLDLEFLHEGCPKLQLEALWQPKEAAPMALAAKSDYAADLQELLGRYNICSKETVVRQFDHEVQGGTLLKPFVGVECAGPGDAAILRPVEIAETSEGIVLGHGIAPQYSAIDAYAMAASAIDEAIRNVVAVGADPDRIALLDNFCWPDPIYHPVENTDGKEKLGQLVRANQALYAYAKAFGTPIISGKDSMKNDYKIGSTKISILPTLLITAVGKISDVTKAVSMDIKAAGDLLYAIGFTRRELGGSEYGTMKQLTGGMPPSVDAIQAKSIYRSLHLAIRQELVASCHDCSEGGWAVAIAESAFSGGFGVEVCLSSIPHEAGMTEGEILFSESSSRFIVSVPIADAAAFEALFSSDVLGLIGVVREDSRFCVKGLSDNLVIDTSICQLKNSWKKTLSATRGADD